VDTVQRERQRGYGPRTNVLMDIDDLEIRCLFTKLSLGITAYCIWKDNIISSFSNLHC